jgi:hypothetical protein
MSNEPDPAVPEALTRGMVYVTGMTRRTGGVLPKVLPEAMGGVQLSVARVAEFLQHYSELTEADWAACTDPFRMLILLRTRNADPRKLAVLGDTDGTLSAALNDEQPAAGRMADALRCLYGNPFRPTQVDPAWLSWNGGTVPKLAAMIRDEGRWADLPILADALEEAGCSDGGILGHCRSGGEHWPGCWVLETIAGVTRTDGVGADDGRR